MMDRGGLHVSPSLQAAHAHMTALTAPTLPQRSPFAIQELLGLNSQGDTGGAPSLSQSGPLGHPPPLIYSRHAFHQAAAASPFFHDTRHMWMNHAAFLPGMGGISPVGAGGVTSMLGLRTDHPPQSHSPGEYWYGCTKWTAIKIRRTTLRLLYLISSKSDISNKFITWILQCIL